MSVRLGFAQTWWTLCFRWLPDGAPQESPGHSGCQGNFATQSVQTARCFTLCKTTDIMAVWVIIALAAAATSASKKPAASIFRVRMWAANSFELLLTATKILESKYHPALRSCHADTFHSNNLTTQLSKQPFLSTWILLAASEVITYISQNGKVQSRVHNNQPVDTHAPHESTPLSPILFFKSHFNYKWGCWLILCGSGETGGGLLWTQ